LLWLAETAPSNGTPLFAAGLVRRGELVELSPPPAEIFVVVGEDTNNGRWPIVFVCSLWPHQYSKLSIYSLASAFAFAFFSGVKTPLYKMVRAYGTWIDDW